VLPLRAENDAGEVEPVDLTLEHSEGELQPGNPLAEVGIPAQLGEGISLPGQGVGITIAGAPTVPSERPPVNTGVDFTGRAPRRRRCPFDLG
jgi:hypothetical protein